jgi:hypothetical protein
MVSQGVTGYAPSAERFRDRGPNERKGLMSVLFIADNELLESPLRARADGEVRFDPAARHVFDGRIELPPGARRSRRAAHR